MDDTRRQGGFEELVDLLAEIDDPAAADAAVARFLDGLDVEEAQAALARLTRMLLDRPDDAQTRLFGRRRA